MNQTCTTGLLSRSILKDRAKGALSGKYGQFIAACITINIITLSAQNIASVIVSVLLGGFSTEALTVANYIVLTICQIFLSVFKVGLALLALNLACGQPAALSDIFYGFNNQFDKALKISAVSVLISQLTQIPTTFISNMALQTDMNLTHIGALFLILLVCSVIYILLYLGFSQVYFLFLDFPEYSAGQLIRQSFHIMKGHKGRLFLLELSFLPLIFLSMLTLGLGDLWLTPYMQLTYTFFFLNLMQAGQPAHNTIEKTD